MNTCTGSSVTLIPAEFRPLEKSRTVSLDCQLPGLFWKTESQEHDIVNILDISKETGSAKIELAPWSLVTPGVERSQRKALAGQVSKGNVLSARGRAYRVLNVVPPLQLEVGRLAGWIELSADPITPTEQDTIAVLKEIEVATLPLRNSGRSANEMGTLPSDDASQSSDEESQRPHVSSRFHNPLWVSSLLALAAVLLLAICAIAWRLKRKPRGSIPKI